MRLTENPSIPVRISAGPYHRAPTGGKRGTELGIFTDFRDIPEFCTALAEEGGRGPMLITSKGRYDLRLMIYSAAFGGDAAEG